MNNLNINKITYTSFTLSIFSLINYIKFEEITIVMYTIIM